MPPRLSASQVLFCIWASGLLVTNTSYTTSLPLIENKMLDNEQRVHNPTQAAERVISTPSKLKKAPFGKILNFV